MSNSKIKAENVIKITEFNIEQSKSNDIEIVYIPNQTQTLVKGMKYKFVFSPEGSITNMEQEK
jgi:hypothetical protein